MRRPIKATTRSPFTISLAGKALGTEAQKANKLRQPFLARRCEVGVRARRRARSKSRRRARRLAGVLTPSARNHRRQFRVGEGASADHRKAEPVARHWPWPTIARHKANVAASRERSYEAAVAQAPDSIGSGVPLGRVLSEPATMGRRRRGGYERMFAETADRVAPSLLLRPRGRRYPAATSSAANARCGTGSPTRPTTRQRPARRLIRLGANLENKGNEMPHAQSTKRRSPSTRRTPTRRSCWTPSSSCLSRRRHDSHSRRPSHPWILRSTTRVAPARRATCRCPYWACRSDASG